MAVKLDAGQKHLLKLIASDHDDQGWAQVSSTVLPVVQKLPEELVEVVPTSRGRGRVRLTFLGQGIVNAMEWL